MLDQFANLLVGRAGGYWRNTIREYRTTCEVCTTPVDGYPRCFPCNEQRNAFGAQLANTLGFLTYAVRDTQSGYVMHGYKAGAAGVEEHKTLVALLGLVGIGLHTVCVGRLAWVPVTHWATIPSLRGRPGGQPLRRLLLPAMVGDEVPLTAGVVGGDARSVDPRHFVATARTGQGSHVLLVDDTWARGGHAQSAVLAAESERRRRRLGSATRTMVEPESACATDGGFRTRAPHAGLQPPRVPLDRQRLPVTRLGHHVVAPRDGRRA